MLGAKILQVYLVVRFNLIAESGGRITCLDDGLLKLCDDLFSFLKLG